MSYGMENMASAVQEVCVYSDAIYTYLENNTVEPRSIIPATIVSPRVPFAIFGPE